MRNRRAGLFRSETSQPPRNAGRLQASADMRAGYIMPTSIQPSQYVIKDYCRGDDGFDAALAEIVEEDRGKPGGITDQDEVFSISVIKGLPGQGEDLTDIHTVDESEA